jgi:hypothetical protein
VSNIAAVAQHDFNIVMSYRSRSAGLCCSGSANSAWRLRAKYAWYATESYCGSSSNCVGEPFAFQCARERFTEQFFIRAFPEQRLCGTDQF